MERCVERTVFLRSKGVFAMTRLILAAGVAALAIAGAAAAKPGGGGGGGDKPHGGGGGGHRQARAGGGRGGGHGQGGGGHEPARAFAQQGGGHGHGGGFARQQGQASAGHGNGKGHAFAQQQARGVQGQQSQFAQGQQFRGGGGGQRALGGPQFGGAITSPNLGGDRLNGQAAQFASRQFVDQNAYRYAALSYGNNGQVLPVTEVAQFVGQPISVVPAYVGLSPLPATLEYLYPPTPDYYYEYGGGYLYQVDRTDNLIAALIPLLAGGFLPGQYLPPSYMASYAPDYYGYDAFYPADYGYGGLCNRYDYGVVYQVDCFS